MLPDYVAFLSTTLPQLINAIPTLPPFYQLLCVSDLTSYHTQPISCQGLLKFDFESLHFVMHEICLRY